MKHVVLSLIIVLFTSFVYAADDQQQLQQEIKQLEKQTESLQYRLQHLQNQLKRPQTDRQSEMAAINHAFPSKKSAEKQALKNKSPKAEAKPAQEPMKAQPSLQISPRYHTSSVSVHSLDLDPESIEFYPTALVAEERVLTYIAGTPVVTSPYLGSRPAFDGSDYIVNISSINRDIRLMQQRRSLERAYNKIGYPIPNKPILALSGKAEPIGTVGQPYFGTTRLDWNLGSNEVDVAAILNDKVEAYVGIAYNPAPPASNGQRVANSAFGLNMGIVNIGDLDESPFYFTAGQLFVPFGRFSTSMISATLPMQLARIKARPVILGYKSQTDSGMFAAIFGYRGDTTLGTTGVGGVNLGYIVDGKDTTTEVGVSFVGSVDDAAGFQFTGSEPGTTFGGFASFTNGSEYVHKVPAVGTHLTTSFGRYNITLEWVTTANAFPATDLSFNGEGAQPQALQAEGGITFMSFDRPSSVAGSYQWTKDSLALNLPKHRLSAVYNISIWKDTVESLEYHHDIDYGANQYANGAAPPGVINANTLGTGGTADTLLAQIGVYF